jgi:REP element-mobilizing transposase RayT
LLIFTRLNQKWYIITAMILSREKGLEIYAYCIMHSHLHLLQKPQMVLFYRMSCDFKKYTSKKLFRPIMLPESRSGVFWLILKKCSAHLKEISYSMLWPTHFQARQDGYHAEIIETNWFNKRLVIFTIIL